MNERHVFVADVHLRRDELAKRDALIRFISGLAKSDAHLYLLGDLFDVWIGEVQLAMEPELASVIEALRDFTASGGKLTFFHGNRDFYMGKYLTRTMGAETVRRSKIIDLDGRRTYLDHGDALCTKEQLYHLVRYLLRSPLLIGMFHLLPVPWKYGTSGTYLSISRRQDAARRPTRHGINAYEVKRLVRRGVELIICGHVHEHIDRVYHAGGRKARLIALPPWRDRGSALEYSGGTLTLTSIDFA